MNGINFPMDGPCMSGTWYNPHTKDSFTVRDTFFENNQSTALFHKELNYTFVKRQDHQYFA